MDRTRANPDGFIFINLEKVFITYEIIKDIIIGKVIVFNIIKISFIEDK